MPDYRCNMLDQRGDVLFPADIVADDLEAALRHAFDVLRQTNQGTSLIEAGLRPRSLGWHESTCSLGNWGH